MTEPSHGTAVITVDDVVDLLENQLFVLVDGPDHDLIEAGELDSLRFVELLLAVEQTIGRQLAPKDLDLDELRTPRRIAKAFCELVLADRAES